MRKPFKTRQPPIIFRDLKPANIILTLDANLYLIDFGIARHFKPGQAKDEHSRTDWIKPPFGIVTSCVAILNKKSQSGSSIT